MTVNAPFELLLEDSWPVSRYFVILLPSTASDEVVLNKYKSMKFIGSGEVTL